MARIRSIKPEFFKHLELQELECSHPGQNIMSVYAGLWTQCDKNGYFVKYHKENKAYRYIQNFCKYQFPSSNGKGCQYKCVGGDEK